LFFFFLYVCMVYVCVLLEVALKILFKVKEASQNRAQIIQFHSSEMSRIRKSTKK
jgi:hypothetical protein